MSRKSITAISCQQLHLAHGSTNKPFCVAYMFAPLGDDDLYEDSNGRRHLALLSHDFESARRVIIQICYVSDIKLHSFRHNQRQSETQQFTKLKTLCSISCTLNSWYCAMTHAEGAAMYTNYNDY